MSAREFCSHCKNRVFTHYKVKVRWKINQNQILWFWWSYRVHGLAVMLDLRTSEWMGNWSYSYPNQWRHRQSQYLDLRRKFSWFSREFSNREAVASKIPPGRRNKWRMQENHTESAKKKNPQILRFFGGPRVVCWWWCLLFILQILSVPSRLCPSQIALTDSIAEEATWHFMLQTTLINWKSYN